MRISPPNLNPSSNDHLLLAYVADLELEVDRLRKHGQFLRNAVSEQLIAIRGTADGKPNADNSSLSVSSALDELSSLIKDLDDPPGYHPALDQVIAIAVRPLLDQVFRWQQRLSGATHAILHTDLSAETINWFPARFRHVLDNLVSNALKYRDPAKGESRVTVSLNHRMEFIELRVTDNGLGMPWDKRTEEIELFYRLAPLRGSGVGVGLAVVKLLIEQSGGSLAAESVNGQGSNFTALLPRYDVGDYLT